MSSHLALMLDLLRGHPDCEMRKRAADEIVRCADGTNLASLLPLLSNPDTKVRDVAGRAILKLGSSVSAEHVSRMLASSDAETQRFIRDLLYRMGPDVVPFILPQLHHQNSDVRKSAVDTVGMLRHAGCVEALIPVLHDADPDVVLSAIEALGNIGDMAAVPHLIRLFEIDEYVRNEVAAALGMLGGTEATSFLCRSFKDILDSPDPDSMTLIEIISALGSIGDPEAFDLLGEHVQRAEGRMRRAMIGAMLWIAERSGFPLNLPWASQEDLLELLGDPDLRIRIRAVQELAGNSDVAVTKALVNALGGSDYFDVVVLGVLETRSEVLPILRDLLHDHVSPAKNVMLLLRMALQPQNPLEGAVKEMEDVICDYVYDKWFNENDQVQNVMIDVLYMINRESAQTVLERILHSVPSEERGRLALRIRSIPITDSSTNLRGVGDQSESITVT